MSAITREPRRVSVVIPTWNAGERFLEVLAALDSQDIDEGFEFVVIDSGSTDGTAERAARAGAYVERIPQADFNHGATRNLGISRSRGEFVALLTQDAVPMRRDYLRNLVSAFERDNVDGVYARQYPRPDCDPLLARAPTALECSARRTGTQGSGPWRSGGLAGPVSPAPRLGALPLGSLRQRRIRGPTHELGNDSVSRAQLRRRRRLGSLDPPGPEAPWPSNRARKSNTRTASA